MYTKFNIDCLNMCKRKQWDLNTSILFFVSVGISSDIAITLLTNEGITE